MALSNPWAEPEITPGGSENPAHWASEREPERERDHAGARVYTEAEHDPADNLVHFPGPTPETTVDTERDQTQDTTEVERRPAPGLPAKLWTTSKVWGRDAEAALDDVLHGRVFTTRPPSTRDRYTRIRRAEWAGELDPLRKFGQLASVPPLILSLVFQAGLWLCAPLRFYVFIGIAFVIVVLAF